MRNLLNRSARAAAGAGLALFVTSFATEPAVSGDPSEVRGVVRSRHESSLATDLVARVRRLPFREGQSFAKGDVLVELDCDRFIAELKAAEAEHRGHRASYDNAASLARQRAAGALDVEVAKALADKSSAAAEVVRVKVAQCTISAPFSGRITELAIHEHDTAASNGPLMKIIDDRNLEIDLLVPSRWLSWLDTGTVFTFHVDETGASVAARVSQLGAAVDSVSQTIKITAVLVGETDTLLTGMSGTARFALPVR